MLTIFFLVLAALVVLVLVAWCWLEIDVPEMVIAATAPAAGACIIYWYWSLLGWIIGLLLTLGGGAVLLYRLTRKPKRETGGDPAK